MGIDELTEHGVKTADGELVYYLIQPDNLSVLSAEDVLGRVTALANLLRSTDELILAAFDSRESFQDNRSFYRERLEREEIPAVRELLRRDLEHLDAIQSGVASTREFAMIHRLDGTNTAEQSQLTQLEKRISGSGFRVRLANREDVKRILAVYYQQTDAEDLPDIDGESEVMANAERPAEADKA